VTGRFLPDKAIDVIDESGSRVRLSKMTAPDMKEMEPRCPARNGKRAAVAGQDFEIAAEYRTSEVLRTQMKKIQKEWKETSSETVGCVDEEIVREVVSKMTAFAAQNGGEETNACSTWRNSLHKRVISQHEASRRFEGRAPQPRRIERSAPPDRFVRVLDRPAWANAAREGARRIHVRRPGSADSNRHVRVHGKARGLAARRRAARLCRYEEGGQLTEKIRRRPYSVVLLDEIEKAHPEIFNILCRSWKTETDRQLRRSVDFRNTIIIMTRMSAKLIKDSVQSFRRRTEEHITMSSRRS